MGQSLKLLLISMNNSFYKIAKHIIIFIVFIILNTFVAHAENLDINFSYGINNVAKSGNELPVEIVIDNKGSQNFNGHLDLNIYETNETVYTYRTDLSITEHNQVIKHLNISLANSLNTISIEIYNKNNELVADTRNNIDLTYYNNKFIIGEISSEYDEISYIDSLLVTDSGLETKIVNIDVNNNKLNDKILNLIDMLIITDYNINEFNAEEIYSIEKFVESGKPLIITESIDERGVSNLPNFINEVYDDSKIVVSENNDSYYRIINTNGMIVFIIPFSFINRELYYEYTNTLMEILDTNVLAQYIVKFTSSDNLFATNDYYSISNLLNVVDRKALPNILYITVFIAIYLFVSIIILYVLLRNINQRKYYGLVIFIFSLVMTIAAFYYRFSSIAKNVILTYISIVDIEDVNTSEKAFLSFRTNESGDFEFNTEQNKSLYPILKSTREPIRSINFLDNNVIKRTVFENSDDRKTISVNNAKSFDTNLFVYENNNYLNDIYDINCSFERFDRSVTGRITNNMRVPIHDAKILMFGKILDIGDINPNYSLSLSRAKIINSPINNNEMLADILSESDNHDILKYYLDKNINGYYDYALFFGFIDNNGTIDINSNSVENVYGRTLLVTKINDGKISGLEDLCSLQNYVENIEGYYDDANNTIRGDEAVANTYQFDRGALLSKIYFENIDSYDTGGLKSNIPFYGDIYAFNLNTLEYDYLSENEITYDNLSSYLTNDNQITLRFVPKSRDPLYRMISLPVARAIANN